VKCGGSSFRFREVQRLYLFLVAVVGVKVEVGDDLHRSIRQCFERLSLQQRVPDLFYGVKVELISEMSTDGVGVR
jgi:hypothetical protein